MKHLSKALHLGLTCCLLLLLSSCAHYAIDDTPLEQWTPERSNSYIKRVTSDRSSQLLVLVAFSGGGTRAASFSYGVLQELADTEVSTGKGSRPLLHEIDIISSVSGGSFTSAYYGLYGDRIFKDYEARFLRQNVEGALLWRLANPVNWFKLASSAYGKADMSANYYDKILFENATFADMFRPDAPVVVINATDLATGLRFPFSRGLFDALCVDYYQYPVSRAVTASSAVPGLFSTITIENHGGSCGFEPPSWLAEAAGEVKSTNRRLQAQAFSGYLDSHERPWLFLVDGGVADNLGLREFYNLFDLTGNVHSTLDSINHGDVRQILIILVDSHAKTKHKWIFKRANPSLFQVLGSVSAVQIGRYSLDTMIIVRDAYEKWAEELSTAGHPVTFHFVEVRFAGVPDENDRNRLYNIGTNFNLSDEEVDILISSARQALRDSEEFQDFLSENRQIMERER